MKGKLRHTGNIVLLEATSFSLNIKDLWTMSTPARAADYHLSSQFNLSGAFSYDKELKTFFLFYQMTF